MQFPLRRLAIAMFTIVLDIVVLNNSTELNSYHSFKLFEQEILLPRLILSCIIHCIINCNEKYFFLLSTWSRYCNFLTYILFISSSFPFFSTILYLAFHLSFFLTYSPVRKHFQWVSKKYLFHFNKWTSLLAHPHLNFIHPLIR